MPFVRSLACVAAILAGGAAGASPEDVEGFIRRNMPLTVRTNVTDEATLIAVPNPYTVACISGMFREIYYWGVYFNDLAFLRIGSTEQAVRNVGNVAYFIDWLGFMPNGNRTHYLTRSQPPARAGGTAPAVSATTPTRRTGSASTRCSTARRRISRVSRTSSATARPRPGARRRRSARS